MPRLYDYHPRLAKRLLVSNAIKYSNTNTSIYLTLFFEKSKLNIMLKDEGFGIAENEKETIFSRFYQTKNNT